MTNSILIAMLVATATSESSGVVPGQLLWGGITTGMTKPEVRSLYPKLEIELSPGCIATIEPQYVRKMVESVDLVQDIRSQSKTCGTVMLTSLKSKYGSPRTDQYVTQHANLGCFNKLSCALRDVALAADPDPNTYWQAVTWFTGDTLIKLYRDRETDKWMISYFQARLAKPEAAEKL